MADTLVLDLETQRSFQEVGGIAYRHLLGVSLVGLYSYADDAYCCYREPELIALAPRLKAAGLVVGFNIRSFDYAVLAPYLGSWVFTLPTLDLLAEVARVLGHRLTLDSLARATLGRGKTGDGLEAITLYRSSQWERLGAYCLEDVRLTRELYERGRDQGWLCYLDRSGRRRTFRSPWAQGEAHR